MQFVKHGLPTITSWFKIFSQETYLLFFPTSILTLKDDNQFGSKYAPYLLFILVVLESSTLHKFLSFEIHRIRGEAGGGITKLFLTLYGIYVLLEL